MSRVPAANAIHDCGVKLIAVTASETTSTTTVAAVRTARRGMTVSKGRKPATTRRRSACCADRTMNAPHSPNSDGSHECPVDVAHGGLNLAASGEADAPGDGLGAGDGFCYEDEGHHDEESDEERPAGLLTEPETCRHGDARVMSAAERRGRTR